ncbi:MAG: ABC transporter substrate-binding protein, partial [Chloroflexota bacterium]|nr:ABC transporter substrate-binding protein [Chloroflexota bacterium]
TSAPAATATPTPQIKPATPTAAPATAPAAEKPRYGGVLHLVNRDDLRSLDMHQESVALMLIPLSPNYSLLMQLDPKDPEKVIPDLAERWEVSPDGKTYTFYLRKGVKFHDGTPLTATDVKFTYDNIAFPPKGLRSYQQPFFEALDKVEVVDDYTVRMVTKYIQASFLQMVALPYNFIYSKRFYQAKGDMTKDVMGSGPYKLKSYDRGVAFEVVKNPDYFLKDRPYLDGITYYIIKDYAAINGALKTRRLDAVIGYNHNLSGPEREALKKEFPEMVIQEVPAATARTLVLNQTKKPWNDLRVRKAIALALDRDVFVKIPARGDGQVGSYVPPGIYAIPLEELLKRPGYRKPKDQDIAEAKRLLAEAGYGKLKFTIISRVLADYVGGAVVVKDQLTPLGMDIEIRPLEDGAYYEKVFAKDFDASLQGSAVPLTDPDLTLPKTYSTGSTGNYSSYSNPKVDELIVKQSQTMDLAERIKLVRQIEEILMEERPMEPFYWRTYSSLWWPYLKNYEFHGLYHGHKMEEVWLAR